MAYTDVISLTEAKLHLRIEDDSFDAEITRMIASALQVIEKYTNHIAFARDKKYYVEYDGCVDTYDYPINSQVDPAPETPIDAKRRGNRTVYTHTADTEIILNVGYTDPAEFPEALKEAALEIINVWFYGSEKGMNHELIPNAVWSVINMHKRFMI